MALKCCCISFALTQAAGDDNSVACSFDDKLVQEVQTHFLEALCPLLRPSVEHEVELPGIVDEMRLQLVRSKVSVFSSLLPARAALCGTLSSAVHMLYCQAWKRVTTACVLQSVGFLHLEAEATLQVLGLWGMGGIGKTTLAAKLFNSLLPSFGDAACFLGNVRAEASHAGGLVKLQQQLLRDSDRESCCRGGH